MLFTLFAVSEPKNNPAGKIATRILFLYFVFLLLPLNTQFWKTLVAIPENGWNFYTLFYTARYTPSSGLDLIKAIDLGYLAFFAVAGAVIWFLKQPKWDRFQNWYYWLRVAVRVRLFTGAAMYACIKIIPMLAPYPSLSDMNTLLGELTAWKLFITSIGIVPEYQQFIGYLELFGCLLLLSRKLASIGAFILICSLGNAWVTNLIYDGGEGTYSFYLLSLAIFVFSHDALRLYQLTVLREFTRAEHFLPVLSRISVRVLKAGKISLLFLVICYGVSAYATGVAGNHKYPTQKGLNNATGLYKVTRFVWNGVEHPPSLYDSLRWDDVVFESWSTLSIRDKYGTPPVSHNTQEFPLSDFDRVFESSGSSGRRYFEYTTDTLHKRIQLRNKNGGERYHDFILDYNQPDTARMVLSGSNPSKDSLYVELEKINKIYLLNKSFEEAKLKTY